MSRLTFLLTVFTLTFSGVIMASEVRSQNLKEVHLSIHKKEALLKDVLDEVKKKTGFGFVYSEEIGSISGVSISAAHKSLYEVLKELSEKMKLRFDQSNYLIAVLKSTLSKPPPPGSVKGRIVEFETSQPLSGASVFILELKKGVQADQNGYYHIPSVPAGRYTLQISFISYKTEKISIEIKEGKEAVYDVKLQASNALNEVVVSSVRHSRSPVAYTSDKELLSEIRQSNAVVSGISNEQISKSADRNMAEVVKRIAGVSVVDDKFVVVRGMAQRYNITYLNNNIAPSTELYSRAFAYDLLPSSIIDRILVYKSPSAELFGDYAGGAVKVFTKNAKPVRHLDVGLQISYRERTTGKDMMKYKGGKLDWLGFDDGTRKLPSNMGNMRDGSGLVNNSPLADRISGFNSDFTLYKVKATPDVQAYVNYFDNWKVGRWRLFDLTSFTYQLDNRNYDLYRQTGPTDSYTDNSNIYKDNNRKGNETQATQIAKMNLLQNFTLKIDNRNSIAFQNFLLNEGRNLTSTYIKLFNSINSWTQDQSKTVQYSFQQRFLYAGNLSGTHYTKADSTAQLSWNLGYTAYLDNRPDQRKMNYFRGYTTFGGGNIEAEPADIRWRAAGSNLGSSPVELINGMMSRLFQRNNQQTYNASADYTFKPLKDLQLKAGTYHLFRTRDVSRRYFKVNRYGVGSKTIYSSSELPEEQPTDPVHTNQNLVNWRETDLPRLWNDYYFRNDHSGLELYDATTPQDAYVGTEQNNSGYLMSDFKALGGRMVVNAGMRLEYSRQKVSAAVSTGGLILPITVNLEKTNLLPSVNITYTLFKQLVLRGSYGRTVNRPDFKELAPYSERDYAAQEDISGNPKLKSTTIDNYDFRIELYPSSVLNNEMFNVGFFYKKIKDPIERYRYDSNNYTMYGYTSIFFMNPNLAEVYGLEAEIRKSLSFVPGNVFRRMSVNINAAYIKSRVSNHKDGIVSPSEPGNFSGRPLQGQVPYVINSGLYYEDAGRGTKLGLIYNVSGASIYAVSTRNPNTIHEDPNTETAVKALRPGILEVPRHLLDFSFSQRIYRSLQMKFTIQNLLDQVYQQVEDNNDNYKYEKEKMVTKDNGSVTAEGDNTFLKYRTGRFYNVSFTYAF